MSIYELLFYGFGSVLILFSLTWMVSVALKNASIVDIFWGLGFILISVFYYLNTPGDSFRKELVLALVILWGLRLSLHIAIRNWGKGEDPRYQEFRYRYGESRYWWFSFFQVFLLQAFLLSLISFTLLESMFYQETNGSLRFLEWIGLILWFAGFYFEAVGDYQLLRFKFNKENKGKVLDKGLWKYTRHPNYFGETLIWWGYGFLGFQFGTVFSFAGPLIMTFLLLKVSGVSMLEKNLRVSKPRYLDYINRTSSFIPWLPKKY